MRTAIIGGTVCLGLSVLGGTARGQSQSDSGEGLIEADPARPMVFRLNARGLHYFRADLDEDATNSGDVSVSRFGLLPSLEVPIGDVSSLTFSGEFTYSFYDFDGTGIFLDDNELMEDAYEAGLSVNWGSSLGGNWTYFLGGGARLSAEAGADVSESWTWRAFGGIGYRISERFVLGGGVAVSSELEDDVLIVPLITAFYQIDDKWMLTAGGGPAAAGRTLGGTLTWQATPDVGVSFTAAWDRREFRLDDDGPIPDGVMTDSRVDFVLGLNWAVADGVFLRIEGGVSAFQEYEFQDEDGADVLDTDTDPAGFVGGGLVFEF